MRSAATSIQKAEIPRRSHPTKSPSGSNISKMGKMSGILVTLCKDKNKRIQRWFSKSQIYQFQNDFRTLQKANDIKPLRTVIVRFSH